MSTLPMAASRYAQYSQLLREFERWAFLPPPAEGQPALSTELDADGWQIARIGEERFPIMSTDFSLILIQTKHITRDKTHASHYGEFFIEGLQEYASELRLLPMSILHQGMRYFAEYESGDEGQNLLCYSTDGVTPSPRIPAPQSPVCSEVVMRAGRPYRAFVCPHAIWQGENKPRCRNEATVAFLDLERKIPLRFQLKGLAMSAWNALRREYSRACNVAKLRGLSIADFSIRLSTEEKGEFMVPVFTMRHDEAQPSRYQPLLRLYLDLLYPLPRPEPDLAGAAQSGREDEPDGRAETGVTEEAVSNVTA